MNHSVYNIAQEPSKRYKILCLYFIISIMWASLRDEVLRFLVLYSWEKLAENMQVENGVLPLGSCCLPTRLLAPSWTLPSCFIAYITPSSGFAEDVTPPPASSGMLLMLLLLYHTLFMLRGEHCPPPGAVRPHGQRHSHLWLFTKLALHLI